MADDKSNHSPKPAVGSPIVLTRELKPDETVDQNMTKLILDPHARHAFMGYILAGKLFKDQRPDSLTMVEELEKRAAGADAGDTAYASAVLTAQAHTLDALFTDLTHRAIENVGQYPDAFQRYMTMAFKAQANCRNTLEALTRLHQPREQVVRHVHVYEGGQAVVAEEFHHHAGGIQNAGSGHQPHTPGSPVAGCAPLPGPHPVGQALPRADRARAEKVPNARRRSGKRSAEG